MTRRSRQEQGEMILVTQEITLRTAGRVTAIKHRQQFNVTRVYCNKEEEVEDGETPLTMERQVYATMVVVIGFTAFLVAYCYTLAKSALRHL